MMVAAKMMVMIYYVHNRHRESKTAGPICLDATHIPQCSPMYMYV